MANQIQFPSRVIPTARADSQFGKYRFPTDLGPNSFVIDFIKYNYQKTNSGVDPKGRTTSSIVLPLPQQIQDAYDIIVNQGNMGFGSALIADQISSGRSMSEAMSQVGGALKEVENVGRELASNGVGAGLGALGTASQYAKFLSRNLLDMLPIDGLSLATDVVTGTAVNPHTTLNFDGVNLKQFSFSWQLAPRSEKESAELKNIINKIKGHILPQYSSLPGAPQTGNAATDRALLKYPDLAVIRFNGLAQDHYFEFKPGMISNFAVDYSPAGNVILEGGKPGIVNVTMQFSEARIHTSNQGVTDSTGEGSSLQDYISLVEDN